MLIWTLTDLNEVQYDLFMVMMVYWCGLGEGAGRRKTSETPKKMREQKKFAFWSGFASRIEARPAAPIHFFDDFGILRIWVLSI